MQIIRMLKTSLTIISIFIIMLLSSQKVMAALNWEYDDLSNATSPQGNIQWNSTGILLNTTLNYFLEPTDEGAYGYMNSHNISDINISNVNADTFVLRFKKISGITILNFGVGNETASTTTNTWLFKLQIDSTQSLYISDVNNGNDLCAKHLSKNTENLLGEVKVTFNNSNYIVFYKNITAYNDAFSDTGWKEYCNYNLTTWKPNNQRYKINLFRAGSNGVQIYDFDWQHNGTTTTNILNMTINDSITREILNVSSITFGGNTYRTTNGTFQIDFGTSAAANQIYNNVVVDSSDFGGYRTAVYNGVNFSSGTYTEFNLSSIDVHFLVFDPFNITLQPYEVNYNTTNISSPLSTGISLNLTHRYDTYNFIFTTNGHSFRTTAYSHNFGSNYSGSKWITLLPVYCHQYASDSFSGDGLNTFSVNALGTSWFTNNGTCIMALENWNECTDIKNNVVVDSSDSGGYFTKTFNGININNYNFPMENVRIQMIGSNALDQTTIPAITCLVNATTITSAGTTCYMNFSQGQASLSISALGGYNTSTDKFATTGNTTYYRNLSLAKTMNFLIKREYDQTCFPFATNNNMSMVVYCSGASQQVNITSCDTNLTIGCAFDSIILAHNNGTFSYFRTLIPTYNDSIVTWYMFDLNQDTGIQIIINLIDFSSQYNSGIIRLKRYFGTSIAEIIEQNFDIEDSVNLYLLKHARYSVEICNYADSCVSLGEIIGDVAEEKTLTIPNIAFFPTNSLLGNQISWQMNWSPNNRIYFNYNDTTHATTSIEFLVYNGSNTSQLYYNNTIMTYDLYASYIIPAAYYNSTFIACFIAYQPTLGIIKDCSAFYDIGKPFGSWEGFNTAEINKAKFWGALIFLFVLMFLFSPYSINAGLVTTNVFLFIFIKFNWLLTGNPGKDYAVLIICSVLSGLYIIGTATKSGGQVTA